MDLFKKRRKDTMKKKLLGFITMTLGTLLAACGVYFFKFPNNFSTGGVSGVSVILAKLIPDISVGTLVLIINVALLIVGFIFLGRDFGGKTVYCSLLLSLSINALEKFIPMSAPLTNQPFMELCFAVLLPSVGSAFLFYTNSSTGGTDIIAMILKKYTSMDIGKALLMADAAIAITSGIVFGPETGLFSVLGLVSKSFVVNNVMAGLTVSKSCTIIVSKDHSSTVCDFITKELHHGATVMNSKGYYTDEERVVIISVINKAQIQTLREQLRLIDPKSFLIVTNTNETYGRGFSII